MDFVDTADPEAAVAVFGTTFPGIDVRREPDGRPFRFRYSRADRGPWARTVLEVEGTVLAPGTYPDHFAVGRRRRGQAAITYDDGELDTTQPYLRPRGSSVAQFRDARVELLIIDRAVLANRANRLLEGSGKRFRHPGPDRSAPVSAAQRRLWEATSDVLAPMFSADSALVDALVDDLATAALVAAFPLTEDAGPARGARTLPRAIRRAVEFADDHLSDPLSVVALADAAHVSVRTVQHGFRQHLDKTPHEYIRDARLSAARRALEDAAPGESTVAAIAREFGFVHASRFARDYLRRFGEYPSATLRR